ncbi:hypothetical protein D3C85_1483060 [compost metagenome]
MQAAGQGLIGCFVNGRCGSASTQIHHLGLRRITQAGIGTALETHLDLARGPRWNLQLQALAIDLLLAEKLIAVRLALGQRRFELRG